MDFEEYLAELEQDAEYREAEKELRPYLDLGNKVLALRLEREWSQAELAKRAGTRQANISRIENGQANPTLKVIQNLANAFGVELSVEFGRAPKRQRSAASEEAKITLVVQKVYVDERPDWQVSIPRFGHGTEQKAERWRPELGVLAGGPEVASCDPQEFTAA